jgi:alkylated DNA repair dioxygenase AlkB
VLTNLLPQDGEAYLFKDFFDTNESDAFFQALLTEIRWRQEPIILFGKAILQPRLTAWIGDADKPYRYSGITMVPQPWTDTLLKIKSRAESVADVRFTNALLNYYRDGKDSMGWHRDNEKELGKNPEIGSVSFGQEREFRLRHVDDPKRKVSIALSSGSFLLMRGSTQHYWYHSIPKMSRPAQARINITFRILNKKEVTNQ